MRRVMTVAFFLLASCQQVSGNEGRSPDKSPKTSNNSTDQPAEPPRVDDHSRGLLFSFFDRSARLRTVDRIADVDRSARSAVMVTDPRHPSDRDRVIVVDLTDKRDDGRYRTWITRRGSWISRVKPKLSHLKRPLEQIARRRDKKAEKRARRRRSRRRVAAHRAARSTVAARASPKNETATPGPPEPAAKAAPAVILYGTSWCGSCRAARSFFQTKGIRFVDRDVEKEPAAAREMVALQQRYGLRRGVVPLILIDGHPYQGFSRMQIEVALHQRDKS